MGIEPTLSAWKAEVLPLNYTRKPWWRGKDSNLRRLSRQIYSLIPLTAREPLRKIARYCPKASDECQQGYDIFRRYFLDFCQ